MTYIDVILNNVQGLTMIRIAEAKACFLSKSVANIPKPDVLLQLLKLVSVNPSYNISVVVNW